MKILLYSGPHESRSAIVRFQNQSGMSTMQQRTFGKLLPTPVPDSFAERLLEEDDHFTEFKPDSDYLTGHEVRIKIDKTRIHSVRAVALIRSLRELFPGAIITVISAGETGEYLELVGGANCIRSIGSSDAKPYVEYDFRRSGIAATWLSPFHLCEQLWSELALQGAGLRDRAEPSRLYPEPYAGPAKDREGLIVFADGERRGSGWNEMSDALLIRLATRGDVRVIRRTDDLSLIDAHELGRSARYILSIGDDPRAAAAIMAAGGPGLMIVPPGSAGRIWAAQFGKFPGMDHLSFKETRESVRTHGIDTVADSIAATISTRIPAVEPEIKRRTRRKRIA